MSTVQPQQNRPMLPLPQSRPAPVAAALVPKDTVELGSDKTVSQHIGNAGFGTCSAAAFGEGVLGLVDAAVQLPGAELVPGLNVGVAALEGYNSVMKLRQQEPVVAALSAGNALGALGTFLGQLAAGQALVSLHAASSAALLGAGATCGLLAGGLGIAAGVAEIKKGRESGSQRIQVMGCLDMTSGVVSLAGAGAMAMGAAPIGVGLLMLANVVDLAGIGVDYLWDKLRTDSYMGRP